MSQGIREILEILDTAFSKQNQFALFFWLPFYQEKGRNPFLCVRNEVIGREEDVEKTIDMLCYFSV